MRDKVIIPHPDKMSKIRIKPIMTSDGNLQLEMEVVHLCDHLQTYVTDGTMNIVWVANIVNDVCYDCQKMETRQATSRDGFAGFYASRKQGMWADDIRRKKMRLLEEWFQERDGKSYHVGDPLPKNEELYESWYAIDRLKGISDPSWWIRAKDAPAEAFYKWCRADLEAKIQAERGRSQSPSLTLVSTSDSE